MVDNTSQINQELAKKIARALEAVGTTAEGYAKELCPVDTGRLRDSITYSVDDDAVYLGSDVEYAPYVEFGTYKQKPQPFMGPAMQDHLDEYKAILEDFLQTE
jgi:HK97 gp10 family phage protein